MILRSMLNGDRAMTVASLVVGAAGIAVLWASGVEFPVAIPPGLVILLVGALFVGLAPWRWAPGVGAFMGLFVTLGFLVSGGIPNLVGADGTTLFGAPNSIEQDTLGTVTGTWIQRIALPSGAREGSSAAGWPTQSVGTSGRSPRVASLCDFDTASTPSVR